MDDRSIVIDPYGRIAPLPVGVPQFLLDQQSRIEDEIRDLNESLEETESDELIDALDSANERLYKIEEEIEAFACFDSEQMQLAGCYVSVSRSGELEIERGLVKKEDKKALDTTTTGGRTKAVAKDGLSSKLKQDLEDIRLAAAKAEMARNRQVAFDLLTYSMAKSVLGKAHFDGLNIALVKPRPAKLDAANTEQADKALHTIRESLPLAWMQEQNEGEQFAKFCALDEQSKADILAYCVAISMQPQLRTGYEATAYEQALNATGGDMASYWRPTKGNFFGRVRREYLLDICRNAFGASWTDARKGDKKSMLADRLEKAFAEPHKHAKTPEQLAFLKTWLPKGMRISDTTQAAPTSLVMIECNKAA